MDIQRLRHLLTELKDGNIEVETALDRLRDLPFEDIGDARLDLHRPLRQGMPEVVFCQNKTDGQVARILERLWKHHDRVLATRVSSSMAENVRSSLNQTENPPDRNQLSYDPVSRLLKLARHPLPAAAEDGPYVAVISAGTSDLPVAEEAAQTAEFFGSRVKRAYDVGVAGIHRLLDQRQMLTKADVVISVAGMEGALTSVVGGLVDCPVVGVPTSVGYGANFAGLAPLLSMLNSCAPGVAVVNIDNGFGAGLYAHIVLQRITAGGAPQEKRTD
jgi:pyridinium-3,5-biscarboxylic acid mononucleotide synthase